MTPKDIKPVKKSSIKNKKSGAKNKVPPKKDRRIFPALAPYKLRRSLEKPLDDTTYYVFDIETTGGNPEKNAITEICVLKYYRGQIQDRFHTLVNPQMPIPPIVVRMTGITQHMVKKAPKIQDVMPHFLRFIGQGVLVSHNTTGDMKFLQFYAQKTMRQKLDNFFICTHLLSERLVKEASSKSLQGLAEYFGIVPAGDLHRASADAEVTAELLAILIKRLAKKGIHLLADAIRYQGDYESGMRLGWAVPYKTFQSLPAQPGIFVLRDFWGKEIFLSSAINLRADVKKLHNFSQLPRALLKKVLSTYSLDFEVCHSVWEALVREARGYHELLQKLGSQSQIFDPVNWHQRSIHAYYLAMLPQGGHYRFGVGPLVPHVVKAFGPVYDRKEAKKVMRAVLRACSGEAGYEGYELPVVAEDALRAYLTGELAAYRQQLDHLKQGLWARINWFKRMRIEASLKYTYAFNQSHMPTIKKQYPLLDLSLIVFLDKNKMKADRLEQNKGYLISQGKIVDEFVFSGSVDDFIKRHGRRLTRRLKKMSQQKMLALTALEARIANGIFFWILTQLHEPEGRIYQLVDDQLKEGIETKP